MKNFDVLFKILCQACYQIFLDVCSLNLKFRTHKMKLFACVLRAKCSPKLHQRSYLDCSLSRYIYLIFCFVFLWPKFKRKKKGRYRLFDVHFQYTPMGNVVFRWNWQNSILNTIQGKQDTFDAKKVPEVKWKSVTAHNVDRWYRSIPICRMESDGVYGNPTVSIHVHRNYWSCG